MDEQKRLLSQAQGLEEVGFGQMVNDVALGLCGKAVEVRKIWGQDHEI